MNLVDKIFFDPTTKGLRFFSKTGKSTVVPPSAATDMGDADATARGLKTYVHGTTYNGGLAPTVTLASGGGSLSSVNIADFMPYQTQDGNWRLKFNVGITVTSVSRTNANVAINGILFYTVSDQCFTGFATIASGNTSYANANPNTNQLSINHAGAGVTATEYCYSGDVRLNAKPTWAY